MELGVMFFSGSAATSADTDAYDLVLDVARFADEAGFSSVWLPERHFTTLGSPYPNPALLHAAVAQATRRIGLRAGSVVLPLHDPLRVAEDWAVVDVLSRGRVGLSLASGWHADDFALAPDRYGTRDAVLDAGIDVLARLWRGETVDVVNGVGDTVAVRTFPRPLQAELPLWVTAARREETFAKAGRLGLNLLTHLLDQDLDRLSASVGVYRDAREGAGLDPAGGTVTVMVHTYVGPDAAAARATAREPYCASLRGNLGLLKGLAQSRGQQVDLSALSPREVDEFVGFLYDRFAAERALIGSPETCLAVLRQFADVGVDEVACLLDFGPPAADVRRSLAHLERLRRLASGAGEGSGPVGAPGGPPRTAVAVTRPSGDTWTELSGADLYARVERGGASYGPALRCVESVRFTGDRVEGVLDLPVEASPDWDAYELHPAILDNAFLLLSALLPDAAQEGLAALPVGLRGLRCIAPLQRRVHVELRRRPEQEAAGTLVADAVLRDGDGRPLVEAQGVTLRLVEAAATTVRPAGALPPAATAVEPAWAAGEPARAAVEPDAAREPAGAAGEPAGSGAPCYRLDWVEVPAPAPRAVGVPVRWVVVGGPGPAARALHDEFGRRGLDAHLVDGDALTRVELEDVLGKEVAATSAGEPFGVACAWPLDIALAGGASAPALTAAVQSGLERLLDVLQPLAEATGGQPAARLWLVTRGAQHLPGDAPTDDASGLAQAPLWGAARVVPHEHEHLWGGIVDLDPSWGAARAAAAAVEVLVAGGVEDQVALRGARVLAPRLVPSPGLPAGGVPGPRLDGATSTLVTGGLGDIGLALAERLLRWGARELVLVSRHGLGDAAARECERRQVAALRRGGARVIVLTADVSVPDEVADLPAAVAAAGLPPVGTVVHLAGTSDGALLATMAPEQVARVLAPKVSGGWNLQRTFGGTGTRFVLVSAIPSLVGPIGVGAANYAAANAFLDALGHWRRQRSEPAVVVNYGPWDQIGMAARHTDGLELLSRYGVSGLAPPLALDLFGAALRSGDDLAVAAVDWGELAASFPALAHLGQFERLRERFGRGAVERHGALTGAAAELLALDAPARAAALRGLVTTRLAAVLGMEPAELPIDRPVTSLGLDSLMALEMRNRLEAHLGITIPMVQLLEGPSVETLVAAAAALLDEAAPRSRTAGDIEEFVL